MDSLLQYLRSKYSSGFFAYCVTITFKPDVCFEKEHPRKASEAFRTVFEKYTRGRRVDYYLWPELSRSGHLHYHGLLFFMSDDYDKHERELRVIRNYFNRRFGRHQCQRIYNLYAPYRTECISTLFRRRMLTTTFEAIVRYSSKDSQKYKFLFLVSNVKKIVPLMAGGGVQEVIPK